MRLISKLNGLKMGHSDRSVIDYLEKINIDTRWRCRTNARSPKNFPETWSWRSEDRKASSKRQSRRTGDRGPRSRARCRSCRKRSVRGTTSFPTGTSSTFTSFRITLIYFSIISELQDNRRKIDALLIF